jgi:translation initiation factor 5A
MFEGHTKFVSAITIKKGNYVVIDDVACRVADVQVSKPGKHGHSKVRIVGVGMMDDKKREVVLPGQENINVPIVEKRTAQVLSMSGDTANLMDSETFETFDMKIPEELKSQIKDGIGIVYWVILKDRVMKQIKE